MTGTATRFKRPGMSLKDAIAAAKKHDGNEKGIRKQFTSITAKDAATASGFDTGICRPTDEELTVINTMTRSPKTADEVVVFSTLSCNDLEDRDLDKFPTDTVKGFAALPSPYGPVGKSFMVGHDYTKMPVGRIFAADTQVIDGATFLTNKVYMPNTDQYKSFIENQDFGIYWAVSVGVMLESNECSVCEAPMSSWGGYCYAGHVKGLYYPKGDEGDPSGWDFADPVEEGTSGAVKCIGLMKGAKDFYELSQVFLGAQFYAELAKSPGMKGVLKAASAGGVVNLGAEQRKNVPLPHLPEKVADAVTSYETTTEDEGVVRWTDDAGLVYTYDPETSEVLCLGKESTDEDDSTDDTEENSDAQGDQPAASGESSLPGDGSGEQPTGEDDGVRRADEADGDDGGSDADADPVEGSDGSVDDPDAANNPDAANDDTDAEDDEVDKAKVVAALRKAGASATLLAAAAEAKDNGLEAVLRSAVGEISTLSKQVETLTVKAGIGDQYLKDVTADAINWYVKAHQDGQAGVNTDTFERLLSACGDNIDLVKSLRDEQITLAQAKFPSAVRRSSFPDDANARKALDPEDIAQGVHENDKRVSRLHG